MSSASGWKIARVWSTKRAKMLSVMIPNFHAVTTTLLK